MDQMHSLLKRQLKRSFDNADVQLSDEWKAFLQQVSSAYYQFDNDRQMVENSLELSSQELMQANADVRAILAAFPDLYFIVDEKGSILQSGFRDSEEMYLTHKSILGRKIKESALAGVIELFEDAIFMVLQSKKMVKIEYWLDVRSFESFQKCYEARIMPFQESKVFIVSRDITESKEAEKELRLVQEQLVQSDKLATIGQLAAGVAHEINNPVGFVTNNIEILKEYVGNYTKILGAVSSLKDLVESGDLERSRLAVNALKKLERELGLDFMTKDVHKLLEQSIHGLERVRKIVLDLKTFAYDDKTNNKQVIRIEEVLDGILSIVQSEVKAKAELFKEYGETQPINCDPQKLGQVFINLLINATQAISAQGKITLRTYQKDKNVCVDISDTGNGIDPENLKKIFDPFFTTKPVGKGTGLGLSVSYEIVKKHGGEIQVSSKMGAGTTFTLLFPAA